MVSVVSESISAESGTGLFIHSTFFLHPLSQSVSQSFFPPFLSKMNSSYAIIVFLNAGSLCKRPLLKRGYKNFSEASVLQIVSRHLSLVEICLSTGAEIHLCKEMFRIKNYISFSVAAIKILRAYESRKPILYKYYFLPLFVVDF